jgi:predicted Rossmann-fold nucleotide-binding protein
MENFIAWILMAAISLPISFLVARGCLQGVMRLVSRGTVREAYPTDVLSSRA